MRYLMFALAVLSVLAIALFAVGFFRMKNPADTAVGLGARTRDALPGGAS